MVSIKYHQIQGANITLFVKKLKMKSGWLLQQVNDPKHTSKSKMDDLKRHKLRVLPGPSKSPDLKLIENLWIDLKRAVCARQHKNFIELEAFAEKTLHCRPQLCVE